MKGPTNYLIFLILLGTTGNSNGEKPRLRNVRVISESRNTTPAEAGQDDQGHQAQWTNQETNGQELTQGYDDTTTFRGQPEHEAQDGGVNLGQTDRNTASGHFDQGSLLVQPVQNTTSSRHPDQSTELGQIDQRGLSGRNDEIAVLGQTDQLTQSGQSPDQGQISGQDSSVPIYHGPKNVTVVVMGRSGMGISSTIRSIIGNNKTITPAIGPKSAVKVILVPIQNQAGLFLRIVDVDGLVDGKTFDDDASTLSSVESYLTSPSGLNRTLPNFFIVISNFDDDRLRGENSQFTQVLTRVATLQKSIYNSTTSNNLFVLTRFMSSTKYTQRRPTDKITGFSDNIRDFSEFKEPIHIAVAENQGIDHDLPIDDGHFKLPNKERYPENVYLQLIEIASKTGDNETISSLKSLLANRQTVENIHSEYFSPEINSETEEGKAKLVSDLYGSTFRSENTEVNSALQLAYDKLNLTSKAQLIPALNELKRDFQVSNIVNFTQLPQRTLGWVQLFQKLPGITSQKLKLIQQAFKVEMPEFLLNPVVGYGFDISQDVPMDITPFKSQALRPSTIGYLLPDFLSCRKIESMAKDFAFYPGTLKNYVAERYKFLGFEKPEIISNMTFEGVVKFGFNLEPETVTSLVSLSALQEIRTIECRLLDMNHEFTDEFKKALNRLTPFNETDKNSPKLWRQFFNEFGTHVVTSGFWGGYMEGYIIGPSLRVTISSGIKINETLNDVISFNKSGLLTERPNYRYFGGSKDPPLEYATDLDPKIREGLLDSWKDSLKFDPVVLQYELKLTPIDVYAKMVDLNIGAEVERAVNLLIRGELIYKRKVRQGSTIRQTPRTTTTTTTMPTTTYTIIRWWETTTTTSTAYPWLETSTTNQLPFPTPGGQVGSSNINELLAPGAENQSGDNPELPIDNVTSTSSTPKPLKSPPNASPGFEYGAEAIGQGYHMLKEIVLPTGPFEARTYETRYEEIDPPCKAVTALQFKSLTSYVENRLRNSFKFHLPMPPNPERYFSGWILPGNRVTGLTDHAPRYVEVRTDKQVMRRKENFQLNEGFWRDFSSLPSFDYSSPLPDCGGKMRWKQFFDKYGTHFVNSLYMGCRLESGDYSAEGYKECRNAPSPEPVTERAWWDLRDPAPSTRRNGSRSNRLHLTDKLRASFEFMSYADFFDSMRRSKEAESLNEALFYLIKNNLSCD